jgi:NUMOD4 motif-containing protein
MSESIERLERWLPVKNYVGYYEVSDMGRVRLYSGHLSGSRRKVRNRFTGRSASSITAGRKTWRTAHGLRTGVRIGSGTAGTTAARSTGCIS